jgi:hypothetical protein
MSITIVECDTQAYLYRIAISDIRPEVLPEIRQRLENLDSAAINDKLNDIIWVLEYYIESKNEKVKEFMFDYYKFPLLIIQCAAVEYGLQQKCMLHLLHENTQNNCIIG